MQFLFGKVTDKGFKDNMCGRIIGLWMTVVSFKFFILSSQEFSIFCVHTFQIFFEVQKFSNENFNVQISTCFPCSKLPGLPSLFFFEVQTLPSLDPKEGLGLDQWTSDSTGPQTRYGSLLWRDHSGGEGGSGIVTWRNFWIQTNDVAILAAWGVASPTFFCWEWSHVVNSSDCSIASLVHRHVLFPKKTCVGLWRLALAHSSWRVILHVSTLPRYKERFEEGGVSLAGLAAFELADVFRLYISNILIPSIFWLLFLRSQMRDGENGGYRTLSFKVFRPKMMQKPRGTPPESGSVCRYETYQ